MVYIKKECYLSPLIARMDFGPTEKARKRSIFNKLKLHVGLLKAEGSYKGVYV
jgi:hypothetical protein